MTDSQKTAAFVGPFISGAIIDRTGNSNTAYYFIFPSGLICLVLLYFLDVDKAKRDCQVYLEKERKLLYGAEVETGAGAQIPGPPPHLEV